MKATAVIWNKKGVNGKYPVKIRVSDTSYGKTETKYFTSPFTVKKSEWAKGRLKNTSTANIEVNEQIDALELKARLFINSNDCDVYDVIQHLKGETKSKSVLFSDYYKEIVSEYTNERTKQSYISVYQGMDAFKPNVNITEINVDYAKKLEVHYRKKGNNNTTIRDKMKKLNIILNRAFDAEIIDKNPLDRRYKKPSSSIKPKNTLTLDQLGFLFNADLTGRQAEARNVFMFMFLTEGCRISDALNMKWSNIEESQVVWFPNKTKRLNRVRRVFITPQLRAIIGNRKEGLLFDFLKDSNKLSKITSSTTLINKYLKIICSRLSIPKVTTHCARHTYAKLADEQGASLTQISTSLGHASVATTSVYLNKLKKNNNKEFLTKMFAKL